MTQSPPSGILVAGRYEVTGHPLKGGMGIVYFGFDHQEQRPVALKTFKPEYLPNPDARARFLRESDIWVRLGKHPHIVQCYEVFLDQPRPEVYLVLELIYKEKGRKDASLRAWLTPNRPVPPDKALLVALQIARGMAYVTETVPGFVHRDLKPENVLVGADWLTNLATNRVRITDFGLARKHQSIQSAGEYSRVHRPKTDQLTQVPALLGTAEYMAPEQWENVDVTLQTDIYAFGCILGEMVTGRMLVFGEPRRELWRAHQNGSALAAVRSIHPALRDIMDGCLAIEPTRRYADWSAVEAASVMAYHAVTGQAPPQPEDANALNAAERVTAGWSFNAIGASYLDLGQVDNAIRSFEKARVVGQAEGNRRLESSGLLNLANAYQSMSDMQEALVNYERALEIDREIGDRHGESIVLGNLGTAYVSLGNSKGAVNYFEEVLAIKREIGDRYGESICLGNLGVAYRQLGDFPRAVDCFEQELAICREIQDQSGEGNALGNLGITFLYLGDTQRAITSCEQALAISLKTGNQPEEYNALLFLGMAHLAAGNPQMAISFLEQCLAISREIGDRGGESSALGNLAVAYLQLNQAQQAVLLFEHALLISREIGDGFGQGNFLRGLGRAYSQLKDVSRSIAIYEQALVFLRQVGDQHGFLEACWDIARLYDQSGIPAEAVRYARETVYVANQIGHTVLAQQAQQLIKQLEQQPSRQKLSGQWP